MPRRTLDDPRPAVWVLARRRPREAALLAAAVGVSPAVAQILVSRGIDDPDAARAFLSPTLGQLPDPRDVPGLDAAARRIRDAIRGGERILVYGDYDVDGISGTALLADFLSLAGADVRTYLPNRLNEGYGLNEEAVRRIAAEGIRVLVTVDHGTTAVAEVDVARGLDLDVVVVDHHLPGAELPRATALVNPWVAGGPGPHPCGVGMAFKIAWGVAMELSGSRRVADAHRAFLTEALALVALGTVADVMPLRGENRVLASSGLRVLARSSRPGLRALLAVAGIEGEVPTVSDVGFKLAPRLNAAGRMGRAELALELLRTTSPVRAEEIAKQLDDENTRRKEIERDILEKACARIDEEYAEDHRGALVVGDPSWHAGVIGIVAARLVDRYHRPAIVVAFDGDLGRGSCRTIPAIKLPEALGLCADHLLGYGGHDAAAGLTVSAERFEGFRVAFDEAVRGLLGDRDLSRRLKIDLEVPLSSVTPTLLREIARLAPFGPANPEPVFSARGVRIAGAPRRMGRDGRHVSFLASDGAATFRAVGFSMGALADRLGGRGRTVDLAFVPKFDAWRGDGSIELLLKDVAIPGDDDG